MKPVHQKLLKQISYSSCLAIHGCPRKMALNKLLPKNFGSEILFDFSDVLEDQTVELEQKAKTSATFAYGKAVGTGVQEYLKSKDMNKALLATFLAWDVDLWDTSEEKKKKTFEAALHAVSKFPYMESLGISLDDYELLVYNGVPAIELGFRIFLPNGFIYRGFIDAVLVNKYTGEIIVLECKTTGMRFANAAMYQNSEQGVSYALVLDRIFGKRSSYSVLYCAYLTLVEKWETFLFPKTPTQRYEWFGNTFDDVQQVTRWIESEYFPVRGESCCAYGRPCQYIDTCHLELEDFFVSEAEAQKILEAEEVPGKYAIEISLEDLMQAQMES